MFGKAIVKYVVAVVAMAATVAAQADVFNMPSGQTSLQTVFVGDPGNAADTATGHGAVGYTYSIGKYEVTNAQYCQFLNAKLPTISDDPATSQNGVLPSDTYGLYDWEMTLDQVEGGINYDPSAATGAKFSVKSGFANRTVVYVSGFDALRFCNWLQNGQGNGDTESGTYLITNGAPNDGTLTSPDPRGGATPAAGHWVLPTENEWYKAAYYKGGGTNSGYWLYPTSTDSPPSYVNPGQTTDPTNSANYYKSSPPGYPKANGTLMINVGSYPESASPYGTLDQGGNAMEWTDIAPGGECTMRGGDYNSAVGDLTTSGVHYHPGQLENAVFGFRVAYVPEVPEPGSFALLVSGAVAVFIWWRRRR